ncbi:MAG: hypothetical protein GY798_12830, partial [Hyphomicrobiales bacterium]|nr:hypothetical protein [Hyphomicrobiales bacterium]
TFGKGFVAKIWMEYIAEGLARVNDTNGKKIVLYLAKHGDEECTRDQIHKDLDLKISDGELADRLYILKQADLIAEGSSDFHFKGLGDPIFAAVFRKRYGVEIEKMPPHKITDEFEQEMKTAKRRTAWWKGLAGEYKVMYYLQAAVNREARPSDVIFNPTGGFTLNGFIGMNRKTFHKDLVNRDEVNIFAQSKNPEDADLIAEVKTWERPVTNEVVEKFIERKKRLAGKLERKTAFLFYSENGFTENQEKLMRANDIMYTTFKKLSGLILAR